MTNVQTNKQIALAASQAGFTGNDLQIAVAVANAESSRNADAINSIGCVGLWQVNQPVWVIGHPTWTVAWLQIPLNNAQAAYVIWKSSSWGAWSTYSDGSYKKYMDAAAAAVGNRVSTGTTSQQIAGNSIEIGPPSGGQVNISPIYLKNTPTMDDFYLMGSKLKTDIKENIISASVEFTTDQVSQVTITVLDPDFKFLGSGLCKVGTAARLQNMDLVVASIETDVQSGNPTVTLKCRPSTVQALKYRRGPKVMSNVSPSDFVKAECKAVGAYDYIQASPVRVSVSRDVPVIGQHYDLDQIPSSWTTFQRLASELGYICFEENGTIYFGQPTYFTSAGKANPLKVGFNTGKDEYRAFSIPQCSKSLDSIQTTISVNLPLSRSFEARCGRTMLLSGVPEFDGYYMISSVSYNLAGQTELMTVEAQTPVDPWIQPGPDTNVIGSMNTASATSDGSWPLPSKYKVTTPYGVRGNWAAGFHTGADLACPTGTPVYAVYDGTVVDLNTWGADYGHHIIHKVGDAEYGYCHLSRIVVAKGAQVKSGQVIGYSGATGNVTGPHLHLEYRTNPWKYNNKIADPMPTLMQKGISSGVTGVGAGKAGSKLASDFVYFAQSRLGDKYVFGATRNPSNSNENTFDCVAEGTLLHTFDGPRKIENIQTGELVWSINPKNGHLELEPVINVFPKVKHKELVIEACGRRAVMSKKHHMAVVRKEPRTRNEKGQWNKNSWKMHQIDAQDVRVGDHVLIPTRIPDSGADTFFGNELIDADIAYVLGQFAGDGSYSNNNAVNIAAVKQDHRDKLKKIFESRFPDVKIDETNPYNMRFTSKEFRQTMEEHFPRDCRSYSKVIPKSITIADHTVKEAFIDGYRDADGSYNSKTNIWVIHSTSLEMLNQTRAISIELGLQVGKVSTRKRSKPITINGKLVKEARDIYSFTTWLNERDYGRRIMKDLGGDASFPGGYVRIVPVTKIYETDNEVTMYDIEVNKNHTIMFDFVSYQCSSLVQWAAYQVGIHNFPGDTTTQSNYCAKKGTGINLDQAVKTRGALLYKIAGGGANDHVVISLGNGKTIEAMGTQYGVVNGSATGRGFNVAYLVPGLRYG